MQLDEIEKLVKLIENTKDEETKKVLRKLLMSITEKMSMIDDKQFKIEKYEP